MNIPSIEEALLQKAYKAFNLQDADTVLGTLHPQVQWPDVFTGSYLHGHEAVKNYWQRQWQTMRPLAEPKDFSLLDGRMHVKVEVQVFDLAGNKLAGQLVQHVYSFKDGLVEKMEIQPVK